jgi:hypothetical protein
VIDYDSPIVKYSVRVVVTVLTVYACISNTILFSLNADCNSLICKILQYF